MPSDSPGPHLPRQSFSTPIDPKASPQQHAEEIAPSVQLVPAETWCQIFSLVCTETTHPLDSLHPKQPHWILLQVCCHWRKIVESSQELWRQIGVGSSLFLCAQRPEIVTARLLRMLHYSGQAPLLIHLDLRITLGLTHLKLPATFFQKKSPPELGYTGFLAIMSLLAPEYQRWQKISFASYRHSFIQGMLSFFQTTGVSALEFPHLTHFHTYRSANQNSDGSSLSFGNFTLRFPELRSLWLKEHLEIDQIVSVFPCSQLEDIQLESNRNIHLLLQRFTRAKRIALLQHRGVPAQEENEVWQPKELTFPHLRELALKYWLKSPSQWPTHLLAPNLRVFKIHTLKDHEDIRAITRFLERSGSQLETLHIQHILKLGKSSVLRGLLGAIPECRVLNLGFGYDNEDRQTRALFSSNTHFHRGRATLWVESVQTFVKVMREKEQHGPGCLYCPRLERLHVELHVIDDWLIRFKTLEECNLTAFGEMVKSRYRRSRHTASADVSGMVEENLPQGAEGVLREVKLTREYEVFQHVLPDISELEFNPPPGLVVDFGAPSCRFIDWV